MFFEIDHLTQYSYSSPVLLGEHHLRFSPLQHPGQRLIDYSLQIDPKPIHSEHIVDIWGNSMQCLQFQGETERLEIRAYLEVETSQAFTRPIPPDFEISIADAGESSAFGPYLEPLEDASSLHGFVEPLVTLAAGSGMTFLKALNRAVHGLYHQGVRLEGPPMRPAETLAAGQGVCRDLSLLFMAACRQTGVAARFVSGYQQGEGTHQVRYLHAWPEAHIPGHGWLGFDPTHDALVGADHVAVAAAPTAAAVSPVQGGYTFRGTELSSSLLTEIRISTR